MRFISSLWKAYVAHRIRKSDFHHLFRLRGRYETLVVSVTALLLFFGIVLFVPPFGFPRGEVVTIPSGTTTGDIARLLAEKNIIGSSILFVALMRTFGYEGTVDAGSYAFARATGLLSVAYRLGNGISGIPPSRVWIPEGQTAREMSETLAATIPGFNKERFYTAALPLEGYLFPDTYLVLPDEGAESVLRRLNETFYERVAEIQPDIDAFGAPLSDVVTMASLLEREARSLSEKRMVAGVLWNRISLGMPLQVDAVFGYIHDRETYHPTFADLEVDSPYNTYLYTGLPPGPIANPGLESLLAAVTPAETNALYYLTGRDGVTRFASTFAEHKKNRELFLD